MKQLMLGLVVALIAMTLALALTLQLPKPRLVGYGCEGADGPVYAAEEDQMPRCERNEALQ